MAIDLSGIAEWLHGWFPYHTEVVAKNQTSANASKNVVTDSSGEVTTENKVSVGTGLAFDNSVVNKINHSNSITAQSSTALKKISFDGQGHITGTANVTDLDLPHHTHNEGELTDSNAHANLGTNAYANQGTINTAIDTAIGNLQSIKAIEVVSDKGTASADKLGKLFIVSENSKVNVYYVKQSGTGSSATYSWEKMDTNILDELVINWSDVQNKPSTFTPSSHTHGYINNNGTLTQQLDSSVMNGLLVLDSSNRIVYTPKLPVGLVKAHMSYSNMGYDGTGSQHNVNSAINTALGNKLSATKVTSWSSTTSDSNVPSEKLVKNSLDGKAPTSHSSSATTYGVGTTSNYGHNKIRDNLTASTLTDGESLSAHQGYVLKGLIDDLEDTIVGFDASNIDFDPSSNIWGDYTQVVSTVANALDWLKSISDTKADKSGGVQQITDANAHSYINTSANATQGTINTAINNAFTTLNGWVGQLSDRIDSRKVYFVSTLPYLGTDDADIYGIYVLKNNDGDLEFYGWKAGTSGALGDYGSWELLGTIRNSITSISLVPKSSDSTGAIRLYYGDET